MLSKFPVLCSAPAARNLSIADDDCKTGREENQPATSHQTESQEGGEAHRSEANP